MDCQKGYLKKEENCNLSRNFLWDEIEKRCEYHDNRGNLRLCLCKDIGCKAVIFFKNS